MSNLFESNVSAVTNSPFEGHCAMTNADEANEVQENVVTAKKGKKRSIKAITSFRFVFFTTRVGGNMSREKYNNIFLMIFPWGN